MSVEKFSISLDPDLGRALRIAAAAEDSSVSSWVANAVRQRLRHDALGAALDEILAEEGWTRAELLAMTAEATPRRRSA